MSLANSRKSNAFSSGSVIDISTSKHTSCLSSLSHVFRPTMTLQESCWIAKRSGARRDPSRARDERKRMPSAYGSALGLTTSGVSVLDLRETHRSTSQRYDPRDARDCGTCGWSLSLRPRDPDPRRTRGRALTTNRSLSILRCRRPPLRRAGRTGY